MADVTLRKVIKRYDDVEAVRGIDLDIADHEFVVLVGPSGCGKSTTLRMIAGLEDITDGDIMIGGDQSLVGFSSDAFELHRAANVEPVPDVLSELCLCLDLRGHGHNVDQRARGVRAGADAVLGLGNARNRGFFDVPHS